MFATLIIGRIGSIIGVALTPFWFISDIVQAAVVAGVFSCINVILNVVLIRILRPERELLDDTHQVVHETKKIVDRRAQERDF